MKEVDLAVIGGGAAGMMAALSAAEYLGGQGAVALLEGGQRIGRKLLATGNGRCNYSNTGVCPEAYNRPDFVRQVFSLCPRSETDALFARLGLVSREEEGRLYPASGTAASVLDVLRLSLEELGAELITDAKVAAVRQSRGRFILALSGQEELTARRVVLATGGKAGGPLNLPGGGYRLAEGLGHGLTRLNPGLAGFCCPEEKIKELGLKGLNGLRVSCRAVWRPKGGQAAEETGEILFRDYGLSGIAIFQLSRCPGTGRLSLDLFPEESAEGLWRRLRERREALGARRAEEFLTGMTQRIIGQALIKRAELRLFGKTAAQLTDGELERLAGVMKDWSFPVSGAKGWEQAQVTLGGLRLEQFAPDRLESLLCPGFYAAGEALDVDGPCGGYNLQWAWSSGRLAGRAAAAALIGRGDRIKQKAGRKE